MKIRKLSIPLILSFVVSIFAKLSAEEPAGFKIQELGMQKMVYPGTGDEEKSVKFGDLTYHVKILHPSVFEGPHFSIPFFWVSQESGLLSFDAKVTGETMINPLFWHSLYSGYFFSEGGEKKGELRGFFLEDGRDNADTGAEGLLFLFDGEKASVWNWTYEYDYDDEGKRTPSVWSVSSQKDSEKKMPQDLRKRLDSMFNHAEKKAERWPGP